MVDFSNPPSLASVYDPMRNEQMRQQTQSNALQATQMKTNIQDAQQNQVGLATLYKSLAPQKDDAGKLSKSQYVDDMGAINWGAFLQSPEGSAWSQRYPTVAAALMEKAGIMGGGKATLGSKFTEFIEQVHPEAAGAHPSQLIKTFGPEYKKWTTDQKIATGSVGALTAVINDPTATPEQKKIAKDTLTEQTKQAGAKAAANTAGSLGARVKVQSDQYDTLTPEAKENLITNYINTGTKPAFSGGMSGVNAAMNKFQNDVVKYAKQNNIDPNSIWVKSAIGNANKKTYSDINTKAANVGRAEIQAVKMFKLIRDMNKKMQSAGIKSANQFVQWVQGQGLDPDLAKLMLYLMSGGREYMKVVTGGAQSIAELQGASQEVANKMFDPAKIGKSLDSTLDAAETEIRNTDESWKEAKKGMEAAMKAGEPYDTPLPPDISQGETPTGKALDKKGGSPGSLSVSDFNAMK